MGTRKKISRTHDLGRMIVDRLALAIVTATLTGISGCLAGYRQQAARVQDLREEIKASDALLEYYRAP